MIPIILPLPEVGLSTCLLGRMLGRGLKWGSLRAGRLSSPGPGVLDTYPTSRQGAERRLHPSPLLPVCCSVYDPEFLSGNIPTRAYISL